MLPSLFVRSFHKQLAFLERDLRHPSLQAKKFDESAGIWQARVNLGQPAGLRIAVESISEVGCIQFLQQIRVLVEQFEKIHHRWKGRGFSAFVAREGVVSAACQFGGGDLAQAQFPANAANLGTFYLAGLEHQTISGCGIAVGAFGVEFDLTAARATPAREALHFQ